MIQLLPLEVTFNTGANLYAVIHGVVSGTRQVWNPTLNSGAGAWEAYNSAHWAQYAVALTEQDGSGYYAATYPANISGVITSEVFYNNASPTLGDAPVASVSYSQGRNAAGLSGDPLAASNAQQAFISEQKGAAAGVPTVSVIPTNLQSTQANVYAGRAVIFTSGAAVQCAGRIIAYSPINGILTLSAPLPIAPAAADSFIIV